MSQKSKLKSSYGVHHAKVVRGDKTKIVKIKYHHRKSYRKRHYASLFMFVFIGAMLGLFIYGYNLQVDMGTDSAKQFVTSVFNKENNAPATISSTYGFSLNYEPMKFFASAIDSATGNLYMSKELKTSRPYQTIKISTIWSNGEGDDSGMMLNYHTDSNESISSNQQLLDAEKTLIQGSIDTSSSSLQKTASNNVAIDGKTFLKSEWLIVPKNTLVSKLVTRYTTYVGVLNDKLLTIRINSGHPGEADNNLFSSVVDSIKFSQPVQSNIQKSDNVITKISTNRTLLDTLTFTNIARAASTKPEVGSSERISAIYSPAVVKIYNTYCMDIKVKGLSYLKNVCDGNTGSGFIVSANGYIATNGHVAYRTAKELAISQAMAYAAKGDTRLADALAKVSALKDSDISGTANAKAAAAIIIDKFYEIPDSYFTATNDVTNLLVGLNEDTPNITELLKLTSQRVEFSEKNSIRRAKVSAVNFRLVDGLDGFRASDIAILKIDNNNLPVTKLGTIDGLTQGASLTILGYPESANNNGLVDSKQAKVTLTSGKVSAIKDVKGGNKKLIETDTTIGSGNSGGPALDYAGAVVGLATYTVNASSTSGIFNYIRDVKDLKDLAASSAITFVNTSKTQTMWEKSLNYFYNARYSKAVKGFEEVKALYSQHPKVAEFTTAAEERIKNGQDVKDFPIILILVGVTIAIAGVGASVFLIVRQGKIHKIYKSQVVSGDIPSADETHSTFEPGKVVTPQVTQQNSSLVAEQTPQQDNTNSSQ